MRVRYLGKYLINHSYEYIPTLHWARPCEKTGPNNQWFKPVASENKSLVRKKLSTSLKKLTSGF